MGSMNGLHTITKEAMKKNGVEDMLGENINAGISVMHFTAEAVPKICRPVETLAGGLKRYLGEQSKIFEDVKNKKEFGNDICNKIDVDFLTELRGIDHKLQDTEPKPAGNVNLIYLVNMSLGLKDAYTRQHMKNVMNYCRELNSYSRLSARDSMILLNAAVLHDIGKINIDGKILKKPGKLNDKEYSAMKRHAEYSKRILERVIPSKWDGKEESIQTVRNHHVSYCDLPESETKEITGIVSLADAFDAMNTDRVYRPRLSRKEIREEIKNGAGTQFEPKLAKEVYRHGRLLERAA